MQSNMTCISFWRIVNHTNTDGAFRVSKGLQSRFDHSRPNRLNAIFGGYAAENRADLKAPSSEGVGGGHNLPLEIRILCLK